MFTACIYSFPDCFPDNFEDEILPKNILPLKLHVYRICTNGKLDQETFLSTYEAVLLGIKKKPMNWERKLQDPITYSTSCDYSECGIRHTLKCLKDYYPNPVIVAGEASCDYGPLQKTEERVDKQTTHVDWWIYKGADPTSSFELI